MESTLYLDLSTDATRKSIFGQLVAATPEQRRGNIGVVVGDDSIPAKAHLHDLADVERAIGTSVASDWTKEEAKQVYRILAQAEAQVHGCAIEETHFHEVGLGMTVREILGMCAAIEQVGPARSSPRRCRSAAARSNAPMVCSTFPRRDCGHSRALPHPLAEPRLEGELCTPTSAAFIARYVEEYQ